MPELPRPALATGSARVNGADVTIRALTFSEARKLRELDEGARVAWMVACAVGITSEAADDWLGAVPIEAGAELVIAITELSGMQEMVTVGKKVSRARKRTSASL